MKYWALYGAEISEKYEVYGAAIHPLIDDHSALRCLLKANGPQPATAIVEVPNHNREFLENLNACLSFIEQGHTEILGPLEATDLESAKKEQTSKLLELNTQWSPGLIRTDFFENGMREAACNRLMNKIHDRDEHPNAVLRRLVHATTFGYKKGISEYLDLQYFFRFSGFEALARAHLEDWETRNVANILHRFLKPMGFDVVEQDDDNLLRGCKTYTTLRNSLFHNGQIEAIYKSSKGRNLTIKLEDHNYQFKMLVNLAVLKYCGFDDPDLNWEAWTNRAPL